MKKKYFKKAITISVISLFFVQAFYSLVAEPVIATAASVNDQVIVTLNVTSGLTLSNGSDVTMAPDIGISANSSIGGSSWVATTNSVTGYNLAVKASTAPALKSATDNFADYTEATPGTPDLWGGVATGTKEFGYSVWSPAADVNTTTWGSYTTCGSGGVPNAAAKYRGFTTSDVTVASRTGVTPTTGVTTNICFAAQQNAVYAASGTYTATITATMTAS